VGGNSTYGTPEIEEKFGAVVMMQDGSEKDGAVIKAFEMITSPYILMFDGDGANLPEHADAMIASLTSGRAETMQLEIDLTSTSAMP
jgi:dolichol-phosphate mannosyltransferase